MASLSAGLLVAATGAAGAIGTDPSFSPGPSLPAGPTPSAVVVADFDGNGSPDLAIANDGYRSNLRILLNDGTGRMRTAPGSPLKLRGDPTSPIAIRLATADFNGDGKPDLAVSSQAGVTILLGDGTGRFSEAPGSPVQVNGTPGAIAAADLNHEGNPDLVVAAETAQGWKLRILLGDGTGQFTLSPETPPVTGNEAGDLFTLVLADFNGDGRPDIAAGDIDKSDVWILLNDGTGRFDLAPGSPFKTGAGVGPLTSADFNGDGKPDLAVNADKLSILLNDGSGVFHQAPGSPFAVPCGCGAYGDLASADFNGDGKPDLALTHYETDAFTVLVGNGSGGFRQAALSPFHVHSPGPIAAADFDGDGKVDLLPLSEGVNWWPSAPRGNAIFFQAAPTVAVVPGRALKASADAVFSTGPITALAADGSRAAACAGYAPVVWTAPGRTSANFRPDPGGAGCDGELAIGGGKVAWMQDFFGNTVDDTGVFVAKVTGGRRHEIAGDYENYCGAGPCDLSGEWAGQLLGAGPLLVFNWSYMDCILPPPPPDCEENGDCIDGCDEGNSTLRAVEEGLQVLFPRRRFLNGPSHFPVKAVGGGRIAVEPAGSVAVLSSSGKRLATVPAQADDPPRGVALSATALALLRRSALDLYDPATGAKRVSLSLGPAAGLDLAGLSSKLALLEGARQFVLVRLSDGKLISFPLGSSASKGFVDAKLTAKGLFYAYNVGHGRKTKGRIVFERTANLLRRF